MNFGFDPYKFLVLFSIVVKSNVLIFNACWSHMVHIIISM